MSIYFDESYYDREVISRTELIKLPKYPKWFDESQRIKVNHKMGAMKTIYWEAFVNENPTTVAKDFNTVSTIEFGVQQVRVNYLHLQYKFKHLIASAVSDFTDDRYIGDPTGAILPFGKAYELACNEINKILSQFVLTGTISVTKDNKNLKVLVPNMYGLLSLPNQIKEEVPQADKDKNDKLFEKIESGLGKLELGDYFDSPMMVLIDQKIASRLTKPYTTGAQNAVVMGKTWKDALIDMIQGINDSRPVTIHTSNLLDNCMLIYPMNKDVLSLHESKFMMPFRNHHMDVNSSNWAHSYVDFVLGGLLATEKTVVQIVIKTA